MSHPDLPEPQALSLSPEEKNKRHWQVISTFVAFVAAYSVIHKLLLPFFLKFTQVTKTSYSQVDPYFIHAVFLAYCLQKERRNTKLISLLCGFGVVYGVSELFHTLQGQYEGWLAVSRLLSAVPLAIISSYVMSQSSPERSFSFAWIGALMGGLSFFVPKVVTQKPTSSPQIIQKAEKRELIAVNQECGNSQLSLDLKDDWPQTSQIIMDAGCGFKPSILRPKENQLSVSNQTDRPINIHLMVFERGKMSSRWNVMVPAKTQIQSPPLPKKGLEVGFLFSDNTPLMGVVGLALSDQKLEKQFRISRSPLKIEEVP